MYQQPNRQVLVVDDHEFVRGALATYLTHVGFQVTLAEDGAQALAILNAQTQTRWHALITDFNMPHVSGAAVVRAARALGQVERLILMSSMNANTPAIAALLEAGDVRFLEKPFRLEHLMALLQ